MPDSHSKDKFIKAMNDKTPSFTNFQRKINEQN